MSDEVFNIGIAVRQLKTHLEQVDHHVPLATIANEIASKRRNESIIDRKVRVFDGKLKVVVGLVELIEEEQVRLVDEDGSMSGCDGVAQLKIRTWESWKSSRLNLFMML